MGKKKLSASALIACLFLLNCTNYQSSIKSSYQDIPISPISIYRIKADLIDTTYTTYGHARSLILPMSKRIKDFVYEITLSVKVDDLSKVWDLPFEVAFILPNGEIAYYDLNREGFALNGSFIEDFKFILTTPTKGWAECTLSMEDYEVDETQLNDCDWLYVHLY